MCMHAFLDHCGDDCRQRCVLIAHCECVQLQSMGKGVNLWRVAPALYYRMVLEVVRRCGKFHEKMYL